MPPAEPVRNPSEVDKSTWWRLSPWLDTLLDLTEPERAHRLTALRAQDAGLADELVAMLGRVQALDDARFMATPALHVPHATEAHLAGQRVGAYRLAHEIGRGGMGTVWLAHRADGRFQGQVAIKFMRGGLLGRGDAQRFLREGQLLARLDHPHIAKLLDAGVHQVEDAAGGQPYLVLEHVAGQPIDHHCDANALDASARVRLVLAVLAAVAHAHSRLILHRDLKPSNILVTADGQPKLLDFGVGKLLAAADAGLAMGLGDASSAELTQFTQLAFTARYAAPEQVQRQDVTTATDVYALGVLLYGLLGGGHPTEPASSTLLAQMQAVVDTVPPLLSDAVRRRGGPTAVRQVRVLRGDLDTIVARALKKDPAERYANAAALADDLRRWLDHEPVLARRDTVGYRVGRFVRRHTAAVVAAASAGALALSGGAALALWQAHQARSERAQAVTLVEFMLGDLQGKLSQLGRTDLLQSVGERALAYYANEDLTTLDSPALARRAKALRLIGESARQRLDLVQARAAIEQAADTTSRLLSLAPDDIQRLQEHAVSLERLAELADMAMDDRQSQALSHQLSALRWRAAKLAPQDPALRLQALIGDQWVASLKPAAEQAEALALLDRVQQGLQALPADLEGVQRARAITQGMIGQTLGVLGRYAEAEATLRAFLAVQPARHDALPDVRERRENLIIMRSLVRALLNQGRPGPAAEVAMQLVAAADSDAATSRDNLVLTDAAVASRAMLAEALWLSGAQAQARAQLQLIEAAVAQVGELAADHAQWHLRTVPEWLVLRLRMQPPNLSIHDDPRWLSALQAHASQLAQMDAQGRPLHRRMLELALVLGLAQGDVQQAQGQAEAARQQWQAVVDRALPAARSGDHRAMQQLALAWLRLNQPQQARPWVERLQASSWRHPDLADLQQRLAQAEGGPGLARAR